MTNPTASSSRRPSEPIDHVRWIALGVSLALLFAASLSPAGVFVDRRGAPEAWDGVTFLVCGWAGPLMHGAVLGWYANPTLFLGWLVLALRRYGAAVITLVIAAMLALTSVSLFGADIWKDEGGVNMVRLRSFGVGFYLWLAAVVVPLVFAIVGWWIDRRFRAGAPTIRGREI